MKYAQLGTTGLVVSRLAFGAMTFTQGNQRMPGVYKVGENLADRLVGQALDAGVNLFDTSDVYASGESEILLGRALKARRNSAVITTKVGLRGERKELTGAGLSRRHILRSVDESLARLGTDWIDVYVLHREDRFTPIEETVEALDTVVRAGKVRYLGFSNWSAWKAGVAIQMQRDRGLAQFTHGQLSYSLLARDVERDLIPMLEHFGLGLTAWSPLAGGFLSGKYSAGTMKTPEFRLSDRSNLSFNLDKGLALVDQVRDMARQRDVSVAQIAIAWLLAKSAVTSVLLGATKEEQLADNLRAGDVQLTAEEMASLDAANAPGAFYPNALIDAMVDVPTRDALADR